MFLAAPQKLGNIEVMDTLFNNCFGASTPSSEHEVFDYSNDFLSLVVNTTNGFFFFENPHKN